MGGGTVQIDMGSADNPDISDEELFAVFSLKITNRGSNVALFKSAPLNQNRK